MGSAGFVQRVIWFLARITPVRWTRESVVLCNKFNNWKSYLDTWAPNQGTLNASKEFAFACSDQNFNHVMSNCSKLHPLIQSLQKIIEYNQWSLSLLDSAQQNEGKVFPLFLPNQFASVSWSDRQDMKFLRAQKKPLLLSLSRCLSPSPSPSGSDVWRQFWGQLQPTLCFVYKDLMILQENVQNTWDIVEKNENRKE